jgi:hypothetical protein
MDTEIHSVDYFFSSDYAGHHRQAAVSIFSFACTTLRIPGHQSDSAAQDSLTCCNHGS